MKKMFLIVAAIFVLASMMTACAQEPLGDPLITVSGKLGKTNSGDTFVVDQAFFDAYSTEVTMNDPWMGDGIAYRGVLIRDLLDAMKVPADATTFTVTATDGMSRDIAIADAKQWDIMLARWADGEELVEDTGGPVKIVFPTEAGEAYPDEEWMWWLVSAEVK